MASSGTLRPRANPAFASGMVNGFGPSVFVSRGPPRARKAQDARFGSGWLSGSPDADATPATSGLPLFDWADRSREHNISAPGSPTPEMTYC